MNLKEANEAYKKAVGKYTDPWIVEALNWSPDEIVRLSKELHSEKTRAEHGEIFARGIYTQLELYNRFAPKKEGE